MNWQRLDNQLHPLDAFFVLPILFADAALHCSQDMSRRWWRQFFRCAHHPHEGHAQLEVPDPLEEDDERDLFA